MIAHLKEIQFHLPWRVAVRKSSSVSLLETSKYLDGWQFVKQMVIA